MNVLQGRTEQLKKTSGTYNSVFIAGHVFATAVNVPLVLADYDPAYVKVKVFLQKKDGAMIGAPIINDSLSLLGLNASFDNYYRHFRLGVDKVISGASVKAVKMRYAEIPFSDTRVEAGQELVVEVTLGSSGVFSAAVDTTASFVQFELNPSIGYDYADFETVFMPILANQPSASVELGDNVTRIMLINLDKTDYSTPVISSLNLSSDRYNETLDFNKLISRNLRYVGQVAPQLIGTALPVVEGTSDTKFGMTYLPQTFVLFDGNHTGVKIDKAHLDIVFNSANVAASQNFIAITRYKTNLKKLSAAADRQAKHKAEEIGKLGK